MSTVDTGRSTVYTRSTVGMGRSTTGDVETENSSQHWTSRCSRLHSADSDTGQCQYTHVHTGTERSFIPGPHLRGGGVNGFKSPPLRNVREFFFRLTNQEKQILLLLCKGKWILTKIIKFVATKCHILRLKCTRFDLGWGSAPDPTGGAYSAPPDPLARFQWSYS